MVVSQQLNTVLLRIISVLLISALYCKSFTIPIKKLGRNDATTTTTSIEVVTIETISSSPWFSSPADDDSSIAAKPNNVIEKLKVQLLQLGAALDRGQAYNPTSGDYYRENMNVARDKIEQLLDQASTIIQDDEEGNIQQRNKEDTQIISTNTVPKTLRDLEGEWELILSTVPHGIFRSSPFFLAIQESYEFAESKTFEDGTSKPGLFFKLHELQTCSWGASKVGRIAQYVDSKSNYLYSTFDTSLFSLTVIPILGWFKLLPTFGGCVVTAATMQELQPDVFRNRQVARLDMKVDYTTSRKVDGLNGLPLFGDIIWKIKVPVGAIWKLLPWNKGRDATCKVYINYVDDDFRIVQDIDGEYFVYTRPVVPRELQIM